MGEIEKGFRNPEQDLELAIQTLEKFTALKPEKLSLNRTFKLANENVSATILQAIQHVRRYHRFVTEKLPKGTPKQQQLAERALGSIQRYNAMAEEMRGTKSWKGKIQRFFIQNSGLDFLEEKIVLPNKEDPVTGKISSIQSVNFQPVVRQEERDLFRAKAISLLSKNGSKVSDLLPALHNSPIFAQVNETVIPESSTITLSQAISPLPGETLIVRGSFTRSKNARNGCVPLPETFEITASSHQTGFPHHPSLYTGWAMPHVLIPEHLLHPKRAKMVSELLKKKNEASLKLMPNGEWNTRAKDLLHKRRRLFNENRETFLELHRKLVKHLIGCEFIGEFSFNFDELCELYHAVNQIVARIPYERLMHTWMDRQSHELQSLSPNKRYHAAETILKREVKIQLKESAQPALVVKMVERLQEAYHKILLQAVAEIMDIPAPALDGRAEVLQAVLYRQLEAFIEELKEGKVMLRENLEKDIDLLTKGVVYSVFVTELREYTR